MENKEHEDFFVPKSLHLVGSANQAVHCRQNSSDDEENDLAQQNGSTLLHTASFLDSAGRIDSSYEDCKNSTSASFDSIYGFFGHTSTSESTTTNTSSKSICETSTTQPSTANVDDNEESNNLNLVNYFAFLDDYIRFDVSRTGVSCFSGYSVSVQYEDNFLVGNGGTMCCNLICGANSRVRLYYREEKAFELEYLPSVSCIRPKDCVYRVQIPDQQACEIGTIHFQGDLVRVYNSYEKCLSFRRKQGSNSFMIKAETGERHATVELFRGLRGDIIYYGLSILGDISCTEKALLIALTLTMDIRQRESDMRCSLVWLPLFCILVIGLFSILPWIYFDNEQP